MSVNHHHDRRSEAWLKNERKVTKEQAKNDQRMIEERPKNKYFSQKLKLLMNWKSIIMIPEPNEWLALTAMGKSHNKCENEQDGLKGRGGATTPFFTKEFGFDLQALTVLDSTIAR